MIKIRTIYKRQFSIPSHSLRRALALACFALGVAGCILPIIPGLPFFVIGGRLLGRRDRLLRQVLMLGRRSLRWMRCSPQPLLRRAGARATPHWHSFTRLMLGTR